MGISYRQRMQAEIIRLPKRPIIISPIKKPEAINLDAKTEVKESVKTVNLKTTKAKKK